MAGGVRAKKSDMGARRGYGSPRWGVGFHPGGAKDHALGHKPHVDRDNCSLMYPQSQSEYLPNSRC